MTTDYKNKITCPYCEYEYLSGEIFEPKVFLGQPKNIERDIYGKIIYAEGIEQNLNETYICDKCGKPFKVKASINFYAEKDLLNDMDNEFTSNKYTKDKLVIKED